MIRPVLASVWAISWCLLIRGFVGGLNINLFQIHCAVSQDRGATVGVEAEFFDWPKTAFF